MANTTWNPSDKTASITLSNLNLTATATASNQDVRAIDVKTTGKFYFEVTLITATANYGAGLANISATLGSLYNTPTNAVIVYASGSIWLNNASTGTNIGSLAAGGVKLCLAVDVGAKLFWARNGAAGNWNNSGTANPATGVGGINITSIVGAGLYPVACFAFASTACTVNFGDSAFTGTVPAGFTAGWSTNAPPPVDLAGNLGGPSQYGKLLYGLGQYSRISAFAPIFAADLDIHVSLVDLAGGLAPQIALGGSLSLTLPLAALSGSFGFTVVLGASSFVSGPLWVIEEPIAPPWAPSEPGPPSMWTPIGPCDPVEWKKTELCRG